MLDLLLGQHPHGDDAGGGSETVEPGNSTVGKLDQDPADEEEEHQKNTCYSGQSASVEMADIACLRILVAGSLLFFLAPFPDDPTVERGEQEIDVDAKIRIEAGTIIDIDIDGGHDDAHDPQIDACLVFQPQVDESHEGADHFQVVHGLNPLDCFCFTGIGSLGKGCPRLRSGRECRE